MLFLTQSTMAQLAFKKSIGFIFKNKNSAGETCSPSPSHKHHGEGATGLAARKDLNVSINQTNTEFTGHEKVRKVTYRRDYI